MTENKSKKSMFYDGRRLLSFNKALSICLSSRGVGKSYYFKNLAVKKAIESIERNRNEDGSINGDTISKFVILRRYKKEIANNHIARFIEDIKDNYPKYFLTVRGRSVMIADKDTPKDVYEIGTFYALTEQTYIRSTVHKQVNLTIFDESVLDTSSHFRYLKNEVNVYLEIISTIARNRDIRNIILGNAIKVTDFPFITMFKFKINPANLFEKEFYRSPINDQVILQVYSSNEKFKEDLLSSNFGKMCSQIKGYADYLIDGTELNGNNQDLILNWKNKPKDISYSATFRIDGSDIGLWNSSKECLLYFAKRTDPSHKNRFALTDKDRNLDFLNIRAFKRSYLTMMLRDFDMENRIFFEDSFVQEKALKILSLIK